MRKADEILKGLLSNYNLELGKTYSSFFQSWATIAGLDLAAHSRVQDIDGQALIVEVDHPGWVQMLQMDRERILGRIRKMYPELKIRELKIHLK